MSCYHIYLDSGQKKARVVRSEEEYRALRNHPDQVENLNRARAGDHNAKMRLVQFNYSGHYPIGIVKGTKLPSNTFGFDIDDKETFERVATLLLASPEEYGLLMLERSASQGGHAVFVRERGKTILENQVRVATLLQCEIDTNAHDVNRVYFASTSDPYDLLFVSPKLFEDEYHEEEVAEEARALEERIEELPEDAHKANKHYRPWGLTPDPSLAREGSKMLFGGSAQLYGGSYGYAGGDVRIGHSTPLPLEGGVGGESLNGSLSLGYSRSDGATPNSDFSSARGFYQGQYAKDDLSVDLQLGYSYKQYGANTFYGAASTDQWESNERYMGAATFQNKVGQRTHLSASLSWNRWFDHYQWHKDSPAGENFHKVDALGATLNAWFDSKYGRTSVGFEARYEGIYSTKLGEPLAESKWKDTQGHDGTSDVQYKNQADRVNYSAFVEHDILLSDWTISLGLLANNNTALDSKWRLYPGVDVSYRPNRDWKLFASWNMALRMPTYTDLYYSGANIVGTKDLKPEKTSDVSLGARYRRAGIKAEASVFYSHKDDMIDWVIYKDEPDGKTFRSGNFKLDNTGLELMLDFLPQELWAASPLRKIGLQYAYINEDIEYVKPIVSSKYAMEYLRHKVVANADTRIWKNLNLSLSWRWQDRVGAGNSPYALLDGRLSWAARSWSVYADCSNLLNKTYFDYSYIPQPGRWGKIGVNIRF